MLSRSVNPKLERPENCELKFEGLIGERIMKIQNNWLLTAPKNNPAMIEMFRNRDTNVNR